MKPSDAVGPASGLCRFTNDAIYVREASLVDELIGQLTFTEMFFFLLMGRRATRQETAMLDAVLVTLMEHGLTPSAISARLIFMSSPEAPQAAIAAGILGVGSQFLGTIEDSARLLAEIVEAPEGMEATSKNIAEKYRAARRGVSGFGHHLHKPDDPRSPKLLELARENGFSGPYVEALRHLAKAVDAAACRHITINATGAIGAIMSEVGIPVGAIRGIGAISRSAGLVAHMLEETVEPLGRHIWDYVEEKMGCVG